MSIEEERQAVVEEAKSWIGTPFHHEARVKGAGVDCAMLIYDVFHRLCLIPSFDISHYPQDWHLHNDGERYLDYVLKYADEMPPPPERTPEPGDIVIWRFARAYSHGSIVVEWPNVLHAYIGKSVTIDNIDQAKWLRYIWENEATGRGKFREFRVFSLKAWVYA